MNISPVTLRIRRVFLSSVRFFVTALFAFFLLAPSAAAQSPLHDSLRSFLATQTQGLSGKVSYTIGRIDSRLQQSPCQSFDPFLPQGARLWGKTTVGVRCLAPSSWTIYVQVQVQVFADYLVAARAISPGTTLENGDFSVRHGDLSKLPSTVLTEPTFAIGKAVKNGFSIGQPLRTDQLIIPWAVQQGQNVRIISTGEGFNVSSQGKALNNASDGQVVQVRMLSGQVITGIARLGGVVDISR